MIDIPEITPRALAARLAEPNPPLLLDVREPEELEIARLPHAVNIPLDELPDRLGELDPNADIVVICRVGGRSEYATALLRHYGFAHARNMVGGTNAWAREVDPSMTVY